MDTPPLHVQAIRSLQARMPAEVSRYFAVEPRRQLHARYNDHCRSAHRLMATTEALAGAPRAARALLFRHDDTEVGCRCGLTGAGERRCGVADRLDAFQIGDQCRGILIGQC